MTRAVEWSVAALADLTAQAEFIAADSRQQAMAVAQAIRKAGDDLAFMSTGRPGRNKGVYEKVVVGLPYIIAYTIHRARAGEMIYILRVVHSARDWQPGSWPG